MAVRGALVALVCAALFCCSVSLALGAPVTNPQLNVGFLGVVAPDVVKEGVVVKEWAEGTFENNISGEEEVDLYSWLNGTTGQLKQLEVQWGEPVWDPPGVLYTSYKGTGDGVLVADNTTLETTTSLRCISNGTATVSLPLLQPNTMFDELTVYFNVTCMVGGKPTAFFDVGTLSNCEANVVENGQPKEGYTYVAGPDVDSVIYFIWDENPEKTVQKFQVTQTFGDLALFDAQTFILNGDMARQCNDVAPRSAINVTFDCKAHGTGQVHVQLDLEGSFDPVMVEFAKTCNAPPTPINPSKPSKGWSAVGIFFFVVFIIVLVGCLSGCIFNYFQRVQRGWDIIPGMPLYRNWYAKLCYKTPTYTPQEDYNAPAGSAGYGSTSYQEDHL